METPQHQTPTKARPDMPDITITLTEAEAELLSETLEHAITDAQWSAHTMSERRNHPNPDQWIADATAHAAALRELAGKMKPRP